MRRHMNFKELTSLDIYNYCLGFVFNKTNQDEQSKINYRQGVYELKKRNEIDLLSSIALNISY